MKVSSSLLLVILLAFHVFLLFNTKYTVWPEMILYPWLLNKDFQLYKDIINPYFPLLSWSLAAIFQLFGSSILHLKIVTFFIIIITDISLWLLIQKLTKNSFVSVLSVLLYIFLQLSLGGNGLWFELALTPFLLWIVTLPIIKKINYSTAVILGFLLAIIVLIKQNAGLFVLPVVIYLLAQRKFKEITVLLLSGGIVGLVAGLFLINNGLVKDFWIWAITLPLTYTSQSGFILLPTKRQFLMIGLLLVPVLLVSFKKEIPYLQKIYWGIISLIAVSFTFPRYEDFHLQVLIGIAVLLVGILSRRVLMIALIMGLVMFIYNVQQDWRQPDRFVDTQTLELANYVKHSESLYLLNSPELVYYFADRLPPKPWATNFPWYFESNNFESRFITGLSSQNPEVIIVGKKIGGNAYDLGNYYPSKLHQYIIENYSLKEERGSFEIWQRKQHYQ